MGNTVICTASTTTHVPASPPTLTRNQKRAVRDEERKLEQGVGIAAAVIIVGALVASTCLLFGLRMRRYAVLPLVVGVALLQNLGMYSKVIKQTPPPVPGTVVVLSVDWCSFIFWFKYTTATWSPTLSAATPARLQLWGRA